MYTRMVAAFAAVYLIWGSTYLAVRFALESFPPFLLMGFRFVVAGAVLYVWGRSRSDRGPTPKQWIASALLSLLLIVGGMGTVAWAQQFLASGTAALIAALTPCFMVILQWLLIEDAKTKPTTWGGVGLGFLGMVVLIAPGATAGVSIDRGAALVLLFGCFCWALGSIYGRRAPEPQETRLATGMQLLCGGGILTLVALVRAEHRAVDWAMVSWVSVVSLLYLIVFGSLIAYTAYVWLLKNSTPARVSTHAYINPIVAVLLGWLVASEVVTSRVVVAGLLALSGVVLIILADFRSTRPARAIPGPSPSTSGLKRSRAQGGPGRAAQWSDPLPKRDRVGE